MKEFDQLIKIVKKLRAPKGCPWDRAQKISNYENYLLEESYELIEAIRSKKPGDAKEELGDLYLILTMITELYREKGKFDFADVLNTINDKLICRHPHVFGNKKLKGKEEVLRYWIETKAKKKKRKTVKDRLPKYAPALFLAVLYLKEIHYIEDKSKSKTKQILIRDIKKKVSKLTNKNNKAQNICDIIFELSELAVLDKINLETQFREMIFKKASMSKYKK